MRRSARPAMPHLCHASSLRTRRAALSVDLFLPRVAVHVWLSLLGVGFNCYPFAPIRRGKSSWGEHQLPRYRERLRGQICVYSYIYLLIKIVKISQKLRTLGTYAAIWPIIFAHFDNQPPRITNRLCISDEWPGRFIRIFCVLAFASKLLKTI